MIALNRTASVAAACLAVIVGLLAGFGWLDLLRGAGSLGVGPGVADALPFRALAHGSSQPLARVAVAWLPTGLATGLALSALPRRRRLVLVALASLILLAVASDAARAIEETENFLSVVGSRVPPLGPLIEAGLFSLACALPPQRRARVRAQGDWLMRSA